MTGFEWWFAALTLLAAAFIIWPLLPGAKRPSGPAPERRAINEALFREQLEELEGQHAAGDIGDQQFAQMRRELEALHQQDQSGTETPSVAGRGGRMRWLLPASGVAVPLLALLGYQLGGAAPDWEIEQLNEQLFREQGEGEASESRYRELYDKVTDRLEERPENLSNRFLLARTATELGEYREALEAYRYILERQPQSSRVVGEMAQVLYLAAGRQFTPEVKQVFDRALGMDPENVDLFGFAGIGAFQSGQYRLAIDYWERGLEKLESGDPRLNTWQNAVAQARQRLAADPGQPQQVPDSGGPSLSISVRLGEDVSPPADRRVFIYARAWEGAPMPLAMRETRVADLPLTVELDKSTSMMDGADLSQADQLEVVARVSASGGARAQSGDWQASRGPVQPEEDPGELELVIDEQVP